MWTKDELDRDTGGVESATIVFEQATAAGMGIVSRLGSREAAESGHLSWTWF